MMMLGGCGTRVGLTLQYVSPFFAPSTSKTVYCCIDPYRTDTQLFPGGPRCTEFDRVWSIDPSDYTDNEYFSSTESGNERKREKMKYLLEDEPFDPESPEEAAEGPNPNYLLLRDLFKGLGGIKTMQFGDISVKIKHERKQTGGIKAINMFFSLLGGTGSGMAKHITIDILISLWALSRYPTVAEFEKHYESTIGNVSIERLNKRNKEIVTIGRKVPLFVHAICPRFSQLDQSQYAFNIVNALHDQFYNCYGEPNPFADYVIMYDNDILFADYGKPHHSSKNPVTRDPSTISLQFHANKKIAHFVEMLLAPGVSDSMKRVVKTGDFDIGDIRGIVRKGAYHERLAIPFCSYGLVSGDTFHIYNFNDTRAPPYTTDDPESALLALVTYAINSPLFELAICNERFVQAAFGPGGNKELRHLLEKEKWSLSRLYCYGLFNDRLNPDNIDLKIDNIIRHNFPPLIPDEDRPSPIKFRSQAIIENIMNYEGDIISFGGLMLGMSPLKMYVILSNAAQHMADLEWIFDSHGGSKMTRWNYINDTIECKGDDESSLIAGKSKDFFKAVEEMLANNERVKVGDHRETLPVLTETPLLQLLSRCIKHKHHLREGLKST